MREHSEQTQELGQETRRAMTLRERLDYELEELERSLRRMRETVNALPPDYHPGPTDPVERHERGEER